MTGSFPPRWQTLDTDCKLHRHGRREWSAVLVPPVVPSKQGGVANVSSARINYINKQPGYQKTTPALQAKASSRQKKKAIRVKSLSTAQRSWAHKGLMGRNARRLARRKGKNVNNKGRKDMKRLIFLE